MFCKCLVVSLPFFIGHFGLLLLSFLGGSLPLFQLRVLPVIGNDMEQVVVWPVPLTLGDADLCPEVDRGLLLTHVQEQGSLHPVDRGLVELLEVANQHESQQVDKNVCVSPDLQEGFDRAALECFLIELWGSLALLGVTSLRLFVLEPEALLAIGFHGFTESRLLLMLLLCLLLLYLYLAEVLQEVLHLP